MKKEYLDKIELAKENLIYNEELSDEECEKRFWIGHKAVDELLATKDPEILEELLEFFNEENEEYGGFCEHLKSKISTNYNADQIFEAYCKKFEYLLENDIYVCAELGSWCAFPEYFEKFRHTFNVVKSKHSEEFLEYLTRRCKQDFQKKFIDTLREDMKKW